MVLRISNRTQNVAELQNTLSGSTNKTAVIDESKSVEQGNDATKKITTSTDKAIIQSSVASSQSKEAQPQKNKAIWLILFLLLLGGGSFYGYQEYQKDIAAQEQEVLQIRHLEQQDIEAWNQAKEINSHYVYRSYLNAWPQGKFKGKAEQAIASIVTAKKLAQQDIIKQAQGLLQQLGYKVSETGNLNEKTVNAIENFETKQNVVVTGQVNDVLITSLKAALKHYKKQVATKALTVKRQKKYEIAPKSKQGREKYQFYKHFNIIDNRENNFPDWLLTPVCENATCSATVMEFNSDNSWQKNTALCAFEAITDASLLRSVGVRSVDNYSTKKNSSGQIESSFGHVGKIIVDEVFDGFTVKILVEDYAELINSNASVSSNTQTTWIKLDGSLAALSFESIAYSTSEENGINESIQLKDDISTEELTQLFDLFSQNNLNVIRFWTNTESKNKYLACLLSRPFKPALGVEL
jgi:hypothetical protein